MEKRKAIGLKSYFTFVLLIFFIGVLTIFILIFTLLLLFVEVGVISPANAGEKEAEIEIARQSEAGFFTGGLEPNFYNYIYFDAEGNVKLSSLNGSDLSQEYQDIRPTT